MQYLFGSGVFWGTPLTDANGAAISNPTPVQLGILQDVSLEVSFDTKMLYGSQQFPVAVGRGKGKISLKAKNAQIVARAFNSLFFGQTLASGLISDVFDVTGTAIPGTPYVITVTPPSSGVFAADLGVRDANGIPMVRVASAPATGQYSVNTGTGAYTFAAADTTKLMFISYQYTVAAAASGSNINVKNVLMGYAPTFKGDLYVTYGGKSVVVTLPNCLMSKLAIATKQDDFIIPEMDIECFADTANNAMYFSSVE